MEKVKDEENSWPIPITHATDFDKHSLVYIVILSVKCIGQVAFKFYGIWDTDSWYCLVLTLLKCQYSSQCSFQIWTLKKSVALGLTLWKYK